MKELIFLGIMAAGLIAHYRDARKESKALRRERNWWRDLG